jgi:hypothetical protein
MKKDALISLEPIERVIHQIRGQRVMLDRDLAALYGVPTSRLNEAAKRNRERFPSDFAFQLEPQEVTRLMSQIAISKPGRGGLRKLPWAFTEHGAVMAANVLRSPRAVQMSVFVVRAFVKMRAALSDTQDLARKLALLEREVKARLDTHDAAIVDVLRRIMDVIDPPSQPYPEPKKIGFGVKERRARYRVGKKP